MRRRPVRIHSADSVRPAVSTVPVVVIIGIIGAIDARG